MPGTMSNLDEIVSAVAAAKKYRFVCRDTLYRIAERELANYHNIKAATKATKRRLHQVYGAFEQDWDYDTAYQQLEEAYQQGTGSEIKAACRHVMELHSSTRERLPILDRFYQDIFEVTGQPSSILDAGCGLNPLALPWMDLPAGARYLALDIDAARVDFLNRYLSLAGYEPLARCQDVLSHPPADRADVALLLKMSPTLERQGTGATLRLIEQLDAHHIVVSYAVKSLGGREKGMLETYEQHFRELVSDRDWSIEKLVFETELVLIAAPLSDED
jgi:16S rRNA (guanine(1405)-N(7))-methyltransferase